MKNRILGLVLCWVMGMSFNAFAAEQEIAAGTETAEEIISEVLPQTEETEYAEVLNEAEAVNEQTNDEINVAVGSNVTVTNTSGAVINTNAGDGAANCVDGSYITATSGNGVYEYNLCFELNNIYPVNKVNMIFLICKFNGNFRVETSVDGVNYTPAGNITDTITPFTVDTTGGYKFSVSFDTVFAKYIKIVDTVVHSGLGFRVAEVEVISDNETDTEIFMPNLKYFNITENGQEITENLYAGTMRAQADIFYYGSGKDITLASGLYNMKTNEMISFNIAPVSLQNGTNTVSIDTEIPEELTGLMRYDELADANIALGAECVMLSTADGSECEANNGAYAYHATDGNIETKAQATGVYNWTLETDLGEEFSVSSIKLLFGENGFPVEYDILVSTDKEKWEKIASFTGNDRGGEHFISFDTVNARYIRVADKVPQPGVRQMQVYEFEVYEKKIKSDFAVRSFIIDNTTDKNPLINKAYVLN